MFRVQNFRENFTYYITMSNRTYIRKLLSQWLISWVMATLVWLNHLEDKKKKRNSENL